MADFPDSGPGLQNCTLRHKGGNLFCDMQILILIDPAALQVLFFLLLIPDTILTIAEEQAVAFLLPVIAFSVAPGLHHRIDRIGVLLRIGDAKRGPVCLQFLISVDGGKLQHLGSGNHNLPSRPIQSHTGLQNYRRIIRCHHIESVDDAAALKQTVAQPPFVIHVGLLVLEISGSQHFPVIIIVPLKGIIFSILHALLCPLSLFSSLCIRAIFRFPEEVPRRCSR